MKVCPICDGTGSVWVGRENGIDVYRMCKCEKKRRMIQNLESGWRGLTHATTLPEPSPLLEKVNQNLWITATFEQLQSHLKYVALRKGMDWRFKVVTDSDLMSAWLHNLYDQGQHIYDIDFSTEVRTHLTRLLDMPHLLIIRTGAKKARNAAMSEVILESLYTRTNVRKNVWVVDDKLNPLDNPLHLCYSEELVRELRSWEYVDLDPASTEVFDVPEVPIYSSHPSPPSLSTWEEPEVEEESDSFKLFSTKDKSKSRKKWGR
jgi:hypothetical protein